MIKHPNCTTREREDPCDDLYCPIHGRIRNMDSGASPFIDPDAVAANMAANMGLSDDEVREAYEGATAAGEPGGDDLSRRLRREAQEADARGTPPPPQSMEEILDSAFDELKQQAIGGCTCAYHMIPGDGIPPTREFNPNCPVHGGADTKLQDRYHGPITNPED